MDYFLKSSPAIKQGYVNYLLQRLTEFRQAGQSYGQKHKGEITFPTTRKIIASQLSWSLNDEAHFEETCEFIKAKIDDTILGRNNASQGRRNYHSFEEHGQPKAPKNLVPAKATVIPHADTRCDETPAHTISSAGTDSGDPSQVTSPSSVEAEAADDHTASRECGTSVDSSDHNSSLAGSDGQPNHEPGKLSKTRYTDEELKLGAQRARILQADRRLAAERLQQQLPALSLAALAGLLGTTAPTLCRMRAQFGHLSDAELTAVNCAGKFTNAGRRPEVMPTAHELQQVRAIYSKLDESEARGRGLGSSKITAFRLVAKSDDGQISDVFREVVLKRRKKTLPPSWERLLDTPASVIDATRDKRTTTAHYINTPRGRTFVNTAGQEIPMRVGTIFEADDGTFNFYAWIKWPFGGDKCSDKFGVKLGRWQLLATVDAHSNFCPHWHVVSRPTSAYRGEDAMALLADAMFHEGRPDIWRLERGSWESNIVRDALKLAGVTCINAWHSKQKSGMENFFDRLWTPLSLIKGHVGRDRARYKHVEDLAGACQDGRHDPRDHFLALDVAMPQVEAGIEFVNGEPIESRTWGTWVPQERYEAQLGEMPLPTMDTSLRTLFSREQRTWTVRGCCVGGSVEGPLIKFPIWFQCTELWEFEGCKVKCFFDPYASEIRGTLVLQTEWRSYKPGHIIAREVPALDLPPQAVLAEGWTNDERERSLAVRKAIAKAVRTEARNWRGGKISEARDGFGNVAKVDRSNRVPEISTSRTTIPTAERLQAPAQTTRNVDSVEALFGG